MRESHGRNLCGRVTGSIQRQGLVLCSAQITPTGDATEYPCHPSENVRPQRAGLSKRHKKGPNPK